MSSSPVISEMRLGYSRATGLKDTHGGSAIWRVAVLATAALVCACESAGPSVSPSLVPALVYQNGNLDLNVPYRLGFVRFNLLPCRDIEVTRAKYGLGPATRVITEPPDPNSDPDDIRSRYYAASVPVGQEAAFVTRLVGHPEDFQYVEFAFIPTGGVPEVPFVAGSTVEPMAGPAGTSFTMRICCFPEGTSVTKTFRVPSGRTIVIRDSARADRTVPAGWGGSVDDERGLYTVTVTSDD